MNQIKVGLKNFIAIMICSIFLLNISSCINPNQQQGLISAEERFIKSGGVSQTPSLKNWSGLTGVCSQSTLTDAQALVCKLDELLDEVAKSGKPLDDFQNEFDSWNQSAVDLISQVCQQQDEITFLVVGSVNVLASRGLVKIPLNLTTVTGLAGVHPIVEKIIYSVVLGALKQNCAVDKAQLITILVTNPVSGGNNPISPNPPSGGGGTYPNPISPNPPSNGGPGSVVCGAIEAKYQYVCQPYCNSTNSCDPASCTFVTQQCKANSCTCN